jgi:uncharacterized protein (TIGR02599 family)
MTPAASRDNRKYTGFTLVEVLVSLAVLALIMVVMASMVNLTSSSWKRTRAGVERYQQARVAFDTITRRLSEATLNTYFDYVDSSGNYGITSNGTGRTFIPDRYVRRSELRFKSGPGLTGLSGDPSHSVFFHAPQGFADTPSNLSNLMNTCGFFVELGSDSGLLPGILPAAFARDRFRLMQLLEPTENFSIYQLVANDPKTTKEDWFKTPIANRAATVSIIAENIIALLMLPKLSKSDQVGSLDDSSLAPNYTYDSTATNSNAAINPSNQLPPVVLVTMVAIDETSAKRMTDSERTALRDLIAGLFKKAGSTTDSSTEGYAKDLKTLEDYLNSKRIDYRIFNSNVILKGAKWSREQKN